MKGAKLLPALLMIVITISSASAWNYQLNLDGNTRNIPNTEYTIMGKENNVSIIYVFDQNGDYEAYDISPHAYQNIIQKGIQQDTGTDNYNRLWWIDTTDRYLYRFDLTNGDILQYGKNPTWSSTEQVKIITPWYIVTTDSSPGFECYTLSLTELANVTCNGGQYAYLGSFGGATYTPNYYFDATDTDSMYYYVTHVQASGNTDGILATRKIYVNSTGTYINQTYTERIGEWAGGGLISKNTWFTYRDGDKIYAKKNPLISPPSEYQRAANSMTEIDLDNITNYNYNDTFHNINGTGWNVYDYKVQGDYELIIDKNYTVRLFDQNKAVGNITLFNNSINLDFNSVWLTQNGYVFIKERSFPRLHNITDLTGGPQPTTPAENETIGNYLNLTINHTITLPYTNYELDTMQFIDENNMLVGGTFDGQEKILRLDISDRDNVTVSDEENLNNYAHSISRFGDVVSLGTQDKIHSYTGYTGGTLSLTSKDGYFGFWNFDINTDVILYNTTNGYVCDNNDEFDLYTIGNDPFGNYDDACYDLEISGNRLYVDKDEEGINLWDITSKTAPNYTITYDDRSTGHGRESGDFLSANGNYLVAVRNSQTFNYYDLTTLNTIVPTTTCNNAGNGVITSVEYVNNEQAIAGSSTGYLHICNVTNTESTENTDSYLLDQSNPILQIEKYGEEYAAISNETIIFFTYKFTQGFNNTPPNISTIEYSSTTLQINQSLDVTVTAGNIEPEDIIKFYYWCEGDEEDPAINTDGDFTCVYDEAGTYNLRVAVSDNFHVGEYFDERSQSIVVTEEPFTGGILRIQVLDEDQQAIPDAQILANSETKFSDALGRATFTTLDTGLYEVITNLTGYYTETNNFYADGNTKIVTLTPEPTGNQSGLVITVVDEDNNPLQDALVSYTNTITYDYDYRFSNGQGRAQWTPITPGAYIVQASKDEYESGSTSVQISVGETAQVTLTINEEFGSDSKLRVDRDCIDDGIWLCGDIDYSCEVDSDCLSDYCSPGTNKCSRFNYTVCDVNGMDRGQRCVVKYSFNSTMDQVTNWLLGNLLWVVVIIIITMLAGFVYISWGRR